jgi:hypothetical protein
MRGLMNRQYFFAYFPAQGCLVHTSPKMLVNWYAKKKRRYGELSGRFIHPDLFGQKGHLQVAVTPVISR